MTKAIGIDLGTTFSAVSVIDEHSRPVIVRNSLGENLTPSVIYFESEDHIIVGNEAKDLQGFGEENIASFFKRSMGDQNFEMRFFGKSYTPTDLTAILLKKLKDDAEESLNQKIDFAVITVPAYFSDPQRKATIVAAKKADLNVLKILNEPTAAAIAFGISQITSQKILVYDLGGGTFDVTVLSIENGRIVVLATGGDHELGGKDWDNRLIGFMASQFVDEFQEDPLSDSISYNDLLVRAEIAKKQLSKMNSAKISISYNGNKGIYEISREKFEEITIDLLQSTALKSQEVLVEANLTWDSLSGVLLVGGSTRMPMVSNWVKEFSGKNPLKGINVDEAVCYGAAIQADILLKQKEGKKTYSLGGNIVSVEDVMSHSLGLIAENQDRSKYINTILIGKNKKIPASEVRPYQIRTGRNRDNFLEVYLTQGETEDPTECMITGKYIFERIEHLGGNGLSIIDIEYKYDDNGVIGVEATQRGNKKTLLSKQVEFPHDMSWLNRPPLEIEETLIPHLSIIIAVDVSGSMAGSPLKEAQKAAIKFIEKIDLSNASVALMPFANKVKVNRNLTQNANKLNKGVVEWSRFMDKGTVGWGNSAHPFDKSLELLKDIEGRKFIIVLADGVWSYQDKAIERSKACANAEIEIIAIGFGGADKNFLKAIATSDENALFTNLESLVTSFSNIAQVLTETGGDLQMGYDSSSKKSFLNFLK